MLAQSRLVALLQRGTAKARKGGGSCTVGPQGEPCLTCVFFFHPVHERNAATWKAKPLSCHEQQESLPLEIAGAACPSGLGALRAEWLDRFIVMVALVVSHALMRTVCARTPSLPGRRLGTRG
jgi:hypothetical protein